MIYFERMKEEHVEEIYAMEKICFAVPWSRESLYAEQKREEGRYIVALKDGRVIGYGGYWKIVDEGNINNIAVHPEQRRSGVGGKIIEELFRLGREDDLQRFFLEVRSSNEPAKRLYRRKGFEVIGMRRGYYSDNGEDAIVMKKEPLEEVERS